MARPINNQARIEQSRRSLLQLKDDYKLWQDHRTKNDPHNQYASQFDALRTLIDAALLEISTMLKAIPAGRTPSEVYDACRDVDIRTIWMRRVWDFFREKFDQRDSPAAGPMLRAADEVVWSCYRQIFLSAKEADARVVQGPVPLPFVESRFSPQAFPPDLVPQDLKREVDLTFLKEYLERLPIPLVRIPPTCIECPWWLIYLGHETGHHVQSQLLPDKQLVADFGDHLYDAVVNKTNNEQSAGRWRDWSSEIFADLYSVLMMGPWAVRAMLELEIRSGNAMFAAHTTYPAPSVRLQLMKHWAVQSLQLPLEMPDGFDFPAMAKGTDAEADMDLVETVIGAVETFTVASSPLAAQSGFDASFYSDDGAVDERFKLLREGQCPDAWTKIEGARVGVTAAVAACDYVGSRQSGEELLTSLSTLRDNTNKLVATSREEGKRDVAQAGDASALGSALGAALVQMDTRKLALEGN
jgi:hypothetical protein